MASDDFFDRVGKLTVAGLSDLEFRLAEWEGTDAYTPVIQEVLPQDRFVPGEDNEFVSDLDFREWSIDEWDGGHIVSDTWNPNRKGLAWMRGWYINDNGFPQVRPFATQTLNTSSGAFSDGGVMFVGNGYNLYTIRQADINPWLNPTGWNTGSSISTGASNDVVGAVPIGDDLYVLTENGTIRKITDVWGTPSNASHVGAGTHGQAGFSQIAAFDERLFLLGESDLWEVDLTTANTITKVVDNSVHSPWFNGLEDVAANRMTATDRGLVWWAPTADGGVEVWEYNVPGDTSARIGRLPGVRIVPGQTTYGFGFVYIPYTQAGKVRVWYRKPGTEGVFGPVPNPTSRNSYLFPGDESPIQIPGFIGSRMVLSGGLSVQMYDLATGAWSNLSTVAWDDDGDVPRHITYQNQIYMGHSTTEGSVVRLDMDKSDDLAGPAQSNPRFEVGRWHFGYPTTYKTVTEVRVQLEEALQSGDTLTFYIAMDGGSWSSIGTVTSTDGVTATFSVDAAGFDADLACELTARTATTDDEIVVQSIRARAITAEARRVWQLQVDTSTASSAGHQIDPETFLALLDDYKETGGIVSFEDPWAKRSVTGPVTNSRVRVGSARLVGVSESDSDRRSVLLTIRDVDVIGRGTVT